MNIKMGNGHPVVSCKMFMFLTLEKISLDIEIVGEGDVSVMTVTSGYRNPPSSKFYANITIRCKGSVYL